MKKSQTILLLASLLLLVATGNAQSDKSNSTGPATKAKTAARPADRPASQKVEDMIDSFQMMEQAFWRAWKDRDSKPFAQHLAPDALNIDNSGLADRAQILKTIGTCDVKNYQLGDFKLTKVDADAALLTYKATNVDATCGGNKVPAAVLASTLFKKTGGTWTALFHQETVIDSVTATAKK